MDDTRVAEVTGPQAAALLRAIHRTRDRLGVGLERVRHLTRALAETAGVPSEAAPWPPLAPFPDPELLASVRAALDEGRTVLFEHLRQDGSVSEIAVEPYHVRLERGYWFLIGRDLENGEERVLRMDKLQRATLGAPFDPRPVNMGRYLNGVFVPADSEQQALVAFGDRSASYAGQRWGSGTAMPDGRISIEIPYLREHWLIRTLMEFGSDFEVIEPADLRQGVAERARATLAVYEEGASDA